MPPTPLNIALFFKIYAFFKKLKTFISLIKHSFHRDGTVLKGRKDSEDILVPDISDIEDLGIKEGPFPYPFDPKRFEEKNVDGLCKKTADGRPGCDEYELTAR